MSSELCYIAVHCAVMCFSVFPSFIVPRNAITHCANLCSSTIMCGGRLCLLLRFATFHYCAVFWNVVWRCSTFCSDVLTSCAPWSHNNTVVLYTLCSLHISSSCPPCNFMSLSLHNFVMCYMTVPHSVPCNCSVVCCAMLCYTMLCCAQWFRAPSVTFAEHGCAVLCYASSYAL